VTGGAAWERVIERRVLAHVRSLGLLRPGENVLLMLSGGADSMAMLQLLLLCDRDLALGITPAALHVDYGLRGADSQRDRRIVEEACAAHGVELHVMEAPAGLRGPNFQERARVFRYDAARALAAVHGYARIATAHNRDDQAETVLYRLAKYPSPAALAGMAPLEGDLVRPLLCLDAAEVRAYCRTTGVTYGEDVSNREPVYARNRLRLQVLPELKAVNPRFTEGLAEAAAVARQERELIDRLADEAWDRAVAGSRGLPSDGRAAEDIGGDSGCWGAPAALDVDALAGEVPALRSACLRRLARVVMGERAPVSRRITFALTDLAEGPAGRRVALPGGWEAARAGRLLVVRSRDQGHSCAPARVRLSLEQEPTVAFCAGSYKLKLIDGARFTRDADQAWIGLAGVPGSVLLRHPRRAERFVPLGAGGSATVLQFLADHAVPVAERRRALVIEVDDAVAWVAGRVAQSFRVSESTLFTLHLRREDK
jgi:tRNA(Ile)-lysidine synthase